ncbi:MAG: GDYXXLXY domain-containing protein [Zoogloeaceae bacterium]|jgi:uncharacterized membrane-anchored protein|nr:GDYXXLXY domain-containing protein [Zoogloeaceae bacterium]
MCKSGVRKELALIVGVLMFIGVNYVIYSRETLLREGRAVFLELAPVDPRSLMQGDYMALDFQVAREMDRELTSDDNPRHGVVVLRLDERGVGHFVRFLRNEECAALNADERCIRYQQRNSGFQLSTNAFFFQEGTGRRYEKARYGEFRVAKNGVALLKTLRDAELQALDDAPIKPVDDNEAVVATEDTEDEDDDD